MLESRRVAVETLCLVHKHVDLVAALQNLLDVVHHDGLHLVDLRTRLPQLVCVRVVREVVHLALQNVAELSVHCHRQCRLATVAIRRPEAVLDVLQERKRQAPTELLVRHAQVRDHVLAHIVENMSVLIRNHHCEHHGKGRKEKQCGSPVVHITHLAILLRDLLKNAARNLCKVPSAAAVLSKHVGTTCNESVDDWHLVPRSHKKKSQSKEKTKEKTTLLKNHTEQT